MDEEGNDTNENETKTTGLEGNRTKSGNERDSNKMIYGVEDVPPYHMTFFFGLQQAVMCIGGSLSLPFILSQLLCAGDQDDVRAMLLSLTLFMSGLATVIQCFLGVRLPIIQGGSHTFVPPIVAMMTLDQFRCQPGEGVIPASENTTYSKDDWMLRMREIQGSIILASITQVLVGTLGLAGFLLNYIGPLTIAPAISLIGLSLAEIVSNFCEPHWGISLGTVFLIIIFSTILNKVNVPIPAYTKRHGCHMTSFPLFQLLPIALSVGIVWTLCFVLTETNVLPTNSSVPAYAARTDSKLSVVSNAPWFDFPLPFEFGLPTFSAAGYVGMLSATISSIMESIGDYFAAARLSHAPLPPAHALNRGIAFEGMSSIISGLVGAGHATTSYSNNIGVIAITKIASRAVFITAGVIMIVCGTVGKVGAVLAIIPNPIIGGTLLIGLALVVSVGVSVLSYCDMSSMRNITILGMAMLVGLMIPQWLADNPEKVDTGSTDLDQVIRVLFGTASFTGGIIGFLLDNIIPGTIEERGIERWKCKTSDTGELTQCSEEELKLYEYPVVTRYIRKINMCSYFPLSPTFNKNIDCKCCVRKDRKYSLSDPSMEAFEHSVTISEDSSKHAQN
ncbi:hypothetical protein FSP39_025188 [Pinctada imbricata]|uniref:Solute carrier family 23 member 2 n=1 Tax=Pinctada imbricata TaxID=66713 RepID=A0AA88Y268_PINIB|nr:hypothetical protein FSP39_025188 [Pinctada imbricata]